MRKLEDLKKERDQLIKAEENTANSKERRKAAKQVSFLNPLITYLEFNPTEHSLQSQLDLANKKLRSLIKQCDHEVGGNAIQSIRTAWLNKKGAKDIRKQIKNLEYLLG